MITLVLPDLPTEDRLLARAIQGDESAVSAIYDAYFEPIYQFLRMRVADFALAEDLAAEVFLKLIRALQTHTAPRHSLRGWLFRVARNLLNDHYGQARRFPTTTLEEWLPDPDEESLEAQFMNAAEVRGLRQALAALPADQQEVLLLRFGQMLSLQETADIMGRSTSAIKSLQFRATSSLRELLAHNEGASR